jgi:hypothetical protein
MSQPEEIDWVASIAQAHDGAGTVFSVRPCADFEFRRQVFFLD